MVTTEEIANVMLALDRIVGEYRSYALLKPEEEKQLARFKCACDDVAQALHDIYDADYKG